jgi:hypothetical protein
MKYREHRGGLAESMATVIELADKAALIKYLRMSFDAWNKQVPGLEHNFPRIDDDTVKVEKYHYDERIKWDTHIVTIEKFGPVGFTDGPCA